MINKIVNGWGLTAAVFLLLIGTSSAQAQFGTVEDRLMIQDITDRYVMALDSSDAQAYAGLFTENAILNVNNIDIINGRAAILEMVNTMAAMPGLSSTTESAFGPMRHIVSSLVLDINGATAIGNSFWMEVMSMGEGTPISIFNVGRYEDEFVKIDGQWYFSKRDILADTGYVPKFENME